MPDSDSGASNEADPPVTHRDAEDLSPSVRRLVRQFDIDIKSIRGSGPEGRLRASDVMAVVGGRAPDEATIDVATDIGAAKDAADDRAAQAAAMNDDDRIAAAAITAAANAAKARADALSGKLPTSSTVTAEPAAVTTVFECEVSRVLAHQKATGEPEPSITSYCVAAVARTVDRLGLGGAGEPALAVVVYGNGRARRAVLAAPARLTLADIDAALAAADVDPNAHAAVESASENARAASRHAASTTALTIHQHGLTGSVVTLPTPLAADEAASLGIGRVRRIVGVRNVNGEDTPRLVAQCMLSLTFRPDRIELARASDFLACCVSLLEEWPPAAEPMTADPSATGSKPAQSPPPEPASAEPASAESTPID